MFDVNISYKYDYFLSFIRNKCVLLDFNFKMNILYLLIGVSLLAAIIFLWLFIWSVKSGQYDDNYTPSVRILFDDDELKDEEINEN